MTCAVEDIWVNVDTMGAAESAHCENCGWRSSAHPRHDWPKLAAAIRAHIKPDTAGPTRPDAEPTQMEGKQEDEQRGTRGRHEWDW